MNCFSIKDSLRSLILASSSLTLYAWLTILLIGALAVGTLIPDATGGQGEAANRLVYHSWWFIALLSLLAVNILACTVKRLSFRLDRLGSELSHIGMVLVLIGGAVSGALGTRGTLGIRVGETADSFVAGSHQPLGFTLRLDNFSIERARAEHAAPSGILSICASDGGCSQYAADTAASYPVAGTEYQVRIIQSFTDLRIDMNSKQPVNVSDEPKNPALLIEISSLSGSHRGWVFSNYPEMGINNQIEDKYLISYRYGDAEDPISDWIASLSVIQDGAVVEKKDIRVNHPLRFGGYAFYQARYNPNDPQWTEFDVVRDPGVPLVWAGFIMILTGILVAFYIYPFWRGP